MTNPNLFLVSYGRASNDPLLSVHDDERLAVRDICRFCGIVHDEP